MNSTISISALSSKLTSLFQGDSWIRFEPETVMSELNSSDLLLLEKIRLLQVLLKRGIEHALSIPEFVLVACSVVNNEVADFESINFPTSLELAWLVSSLKSLAEVRGVGLNFPLAFKGVITYFLIEDGFSEPLPPFEFLDRSSFHEGQLPQDTSLKAQALVSYLRYMNSLSQNHA